MTRHLAIVLAAAAVAAAQPGVVPPAKPAPVQPPQLTQPVPRPVYTPIVRRDAEGKVIRLHGSIDALALRNNPMISPAEMDAMKPVIAEWTADVNQVVADNLDFVEIIDSGYFDRYDQSDPAQVAYIQKINSQLGAAGPLATRLTMARLFSGNAAGVNMQITNEYTQAIFNEINTGPSLPGETQAQHAMRRSLLVGRYYTALQSRDAMGQYYRILLDAAPMLDQIIEGLPESARAAARAGLPAVQSASSEAATIAAVRALIAPLSFDHRREFILKAVALGAAPDPFSPPSDLPPPAPSAKPSSN